MTFAVLEVTRSAVAVGVVMAARAVPIVGFTLVSGVLADRYCRRRLMVISDVICLAGQATLTVLVLTHSATVVAAACLQALHGFGTALFQPASSGMIRDVVPDHSLRKANALLGVSGGISVAIGPAAGGAMIAATSPAFGLMADSVTFLASGALLLTIRRPAGRIPDGRGSRARADFRQGWREFVTRRWVLVSVAYFALYQMVVLAPLLVIGPVLFAGTEDGSRSWGLLLTCSGLGNVVGGLAAYRHTAGRILVTAYALTFPTLPPLVLLAAEAPVPLLAASMVVFGAGLSYADTLWNTALQGNVPANLVGRLSSYDWFGSTALRPLGLALAGPLAGAIGSHALLYTAAAAGTVMTIVALMPAEVRNLQGVERGLPAGGPVRADE
ncbi:MFS family permease [Saccharothrix coeruleofusca]|nr:MFS family permease [Saccharothrix coeruleofusca]